jgi:DNA-binding MarR family transcriptional regulator
MSDRPGNRLGKPPSTTVIRRLARFRYELRRFLRFSEQSARAAGITPQQHQLLLGVAGYTGRGWATVSELAEFLQERHNAVVGLLERASRRGLVRKSAIARDRRFVRVELTPAGKRILAGLSELHLKELTRFQARTDPVFATGSTATAESSEEREGPAVCGLPGIVGPRLSAR